MSPDAINEGEGGYKMHCMIAYTFPVYFLKLQSLDIFSPILSAYYRKINWAHAALIKILFTETSQSGTYHQYMLSLVLCPEFMILSTLGRIAGRGLQWMLKRRGRPCLPAGHNIKVVTSLATVCITQQIYTDMSIRYKMHIRHLHRILNYFLK